VTKRVIPFHLGRLLDRDPAVNEQFLRQGKWLIVDFEQAIKKGSKRVDMSLMAGDQILIPSYPHVVKIV
jgi:hypothetical protein